MKKIILFTNMSSIQKHWEGALAKSEYEIVLMQEFKKLIDYLDNDVSSLIVMFDEMSVHNIFSALDELNKYKNIKILLFNSLPEVHHASTLLTTGIMGYENSFLYKANLLKMLSSIENGNRWLFSELTHYIINKYVKQISNVEPDFMSKLTEKEKDIATMISNGLSNKEIAEKEKIALSTVKGHVHNIFEKANVNDRVSLVLKFK